MVLSNLDQPAAATNASPFTGQGIEGGTVDRTFFAAEMQLYPNAPHSSQLTLEVEARVGIAGTPGPTLFQDFTPTDEPGGLVMFTANSKFVLQAGTDYWLVLSDPGTPGGVNLAVHALAGLPVRPRVWAAGV